MPQGAIRFLLPLLILGIACARPVAVGTDPGAAYAVEIVNRTGVSLDVSFEGAGGTHALGSVAAGAAERFVVVSPGSLDVTIVGTGAGVTARQRVSLQAGETVRVVLQG